MSKKRRLEQLKAWAGLASEDPVLVGIAGSANSPTQAYELAYIETGDAKKARSCRFLQMIKRDYGKDEFDLFVPPAISVSPREESTGKRKGTDMSTKTGEKGVTQLLPLRHVSYVGVVNGAFARVRCRQEFGNDTDHPLEPIYVFPLPDDAAVTGCTMVIGRCRVAASLKKKEEARREYDTAVAGGHHGALLEQKRPNIFTMNVGGIEPGEKIVVEVDYVQRIPWQAGGGRFRIPLVVAPRFIPGVPTGRSGGGWAEDTGEVPDASQITPNVAEAGVPYNADIRISFSPGFRCEVNCPSHDTIVPKQVVAKADTVEFKTGDIRTDRDFTLAYRSMSRVPEVAVHSGSFGAGTEQEGFLLASIIPPGDAPAGSNNRVVMVLDCSGSMAGPKIDGLRVVAKKVVGILRDQQSGFLVGILPFRNSPLPCHPISEISEATESFIDTLEDGGNTMLGPALEEAKRMLGDSGERTILLVTDGETESGVNWNGNGICLISVGIDTAVNDSMLKELSRRNSGVAEFIYPGEDYGAIASRLAGFLSGPVLRDVKVVALGDVVGVCDVFKSRPATISIRFKDKPGKVRISGNSGLDSNLPFWDVDGAGAKDCDFAAQVWARDFIREKPQDVDAQVTASLKYGVICQHTSFVAVSEKEVPGQKPERVEIPVNLPDTWVYDEVFGQGVVLGAPMRHVRYGGSINAMSVTMTGAHGGGPDTDDDMLMSFEACSSPESLDVGFDGAGTTRGGSSRPKGKGIRAKLGDMLGKALGRKPKGSGPVVPPFQPPPKPPQPTGRFVLDASDLADRLVAILIAILGNNRAGAEKAFKTVQAELTRKAADKLDPVKKAMAYYFALRLSKHGLRFDSSVMKALSAELKDKTHTAFAWYNLALKEQGRPYAGIVPFDADIAAYISWKLGEGVKPATGDWAQVP